MQLFVQLKGANGAEYGLRKAEFWVLDGESDTVSLVLAWVLQAPGGDLLRLDNGILLPFKPLAIPQTRVFWVKHPGGDLEQVHSHVRKQHAQILSVIVGRVRQNRKK